MMKIYDAMASLKPSDGAAIAHRLRPEARDFIRGCPLPPLQRQHQFGGEAGVVVFQLQRTLVEFHDAGDEA